MDYSDSMHYSIVTKGECDEFVNVIKHRTAALKAIHNCVAIKYFLRFKMSAKAPLGRPSKKTGKLDAV